MAGTVRDVVADCAAAATFLVESFHFDHANREAGAVLPTNIEFASMWSLSIGILLAFRPIFLLVRSMI